MEPELGSRPRDFLYCWVDIAIGVLRDDCIDRENVRKEGERGAQLLVLGFVVDTAAMAIGVHPVKVGIADLSGMSTNPQTVNDPLA